MPLSKSDKNKEAKAAEEAEAEAKAAEEAEVRVSTITLVTPYRQVHPSTGQVFSPGTPVLKVPVDRWVQAMIAAKCFEEEK